MVQGMCIACELGYWSMIDAIEAERAAANDMAPARGEARFICSDTDESEQTAGPQVSGDESLGRD